MKRLTLLTLLAACLVAPACGQSAGAREDSPLAAVVPETQDLLDRMDTAALAIETLRARFDYELNQTLYEDVQKRKGELVFRTPNLLRFQFTDPPRETFVFDGRMLYHKKDTMQQLILWEVRRPDEPAVDSFELGKTPFPMPFGQKKETVLKHFDVSEDKAQAAEDKAGRRVLILKPKPDTPLADTYTEIALWVDPQTFLPARTRLTDTSENITTIDFHHIETSAKVDAKVFERPEVPADWEIMTHAKEPAASEAGESP
ncbi:MAG: outer membrane lipoprotein carrier protein LolA [Phycisphaerae bacterium]|nr:outer membrane lipoprotein carrier protein LolA [Phycisphaerae bacterium]